MTRRRLWRRPGLLLVVPAMLGIAACSDDTGPAGPGGAETLLLSVEPRGGAVGVDPGAPITVTFDHPMHPAMSEYAALHEGDVTGPEVEGTWGWSEGGATLTFTPAAPLAPATAYTIHLGGGMHDANGHPVDLGAHGAHMGGDWATSGMMGGGMMGGGTGGVPGSDHMGQGWRHPSNGSYGMVFSFTTA